MCRLDVGLEAFHELAVACPHLVLDLVDQRERHLHALLEFVELLLVLLVQSIALLAAASLKGS